jgi:acetyl-CoA carboxylase biotin carboxylase subunit
MLYPGYAVPPFYDSLLGKLIVWAEDRDKALMRLKRALDELQIDGLPTTAPLFQALLESDDVRASTVHTRWLEPWLAENLDLIRQKGGSET